MNELSTQERLEWLEQTVKYQTTQLDTIIQIILQMLKEEEKQKRLSFV